jgi:hypothetical protein
MASSGQQRRLKAIEQFIGFSVQHLLSLTPDTRHLKPSISYNMLSENPR